MPKSHVTYTPWLRASISCKKGNVRSTMEDRVVTETFTVKSTQAYVFLVLDGHGGTEAVDLVKKQFVPTLKACLVSDSIRPCITSAFAQMHEKTKSLKSGTTVSMLLVLEQEKKKQFWIANLGDSSVIGIQIQGQKEPKIQKLTIDHKPKLKSEQKKFSEKGVTIKVEDGYMINPEGSGLAMTRSLGDAEFNVLREPTIHQLQIPWDVIVLCTDGFTDVVNSRELFLLLAQDDKAWEESAKRLNVLRNKKFAQHDNTSIIIVFIDRKQDLEAKSGP